MGIIGIFSSTVIAQPFTTDTTIISGKDVGYTSFPLIVTNTQPPSNNTWGRVIRVTGTNAPIVQPYNINSFFDIGVDDAGNFFINSPTDTKTSHSLVISRTGHVTIRP